MTKLPSDVARLLESQFQLNAYPDRNTKLALALASAVNHHTVNVWFNNRRAKHKRDRRRSCCSLSSARAHTKGCLNYILN